jgi:hypothetical protein
MMPPSAFASSSTPALCAIIAPPSTRAGSLGASTNLATVNAGLWRSSTCIDTSIGDGAASVNHVFSPDRQAEFIGG